MEPSAAGFGFKLDEITKSLGENSEFWNQFAGSGIANVFMMLAVGLYVGVRKLCERDSKCKSHVHCCCLELDVRDRTLREESENKDQSGPEAV